MGDETLHARLLARLDEEDIGDNVANALRAVVELHAPDSELPNACGTCCCSSWPCWTIRAIARELGIEATDRG